ncbi:MAM and LDL-receptor class A domain-containing protein 1-like [Lingula anatina]|uniref:MAM and LDL-receptor class A domain-containing protein 1-like n=1 Tax=Lingula anatina TaxID=7574 RepID=A0A1S3IDH9_LINAN|nr:MAM and LDL-receptor class A domain-containing protein 1-like [Lingula anatina]|eukprot:XP_013395916.1 MAM and LDL-receptor class A domain-containing protein 1-like [Lingula anatina]
MIDQTDDNVDWIRKTGSTTSSYTGASADHTSGSGHYMYIEASDYSMSDSDKARLATPYLNNPSGCSGRVSFWYHAYGSGLGHLKVFYMKAGDSTLYGPVWTHPGVTESHNQWKTGSVEIPTTSAYKVVFEASRGTSSKSDYCLDDISITAGRCGGWWFNCDFEQDECGLVQSTADDGDWTRHTGSTFTSGTGPSGDHTTGSGYYMYMEASSMANNEYVILETPLFPVLNAQCTTVTVNLWYHAFGNQWRSFMVSYVDSIGSYSLFHIKEWEKDFWRFVSSTFKPSVNFKMQFYAERRNGEAADIAIDDISISQADCALNTAHELSQASPYQCTFDDGTCQFVQDGHSDDNFDWYLNTKDTQKSNTGPSQDHTSGIGYYYYVNTRLNDVSGHTARLLSPNFHSSCGGATLGFWYNADGNALAGLNVKLKKVGSSENLLWHHDGTDENDVWREVTLEIDSDTNFVIVFETESRGQEGEYAIDDVTLTVPSDCGVFTYNFTCNFDTNDCGVTQRTDDNGDWQRNSGATSTSGTGPSSDHSGSGSYFYIDGTYFGDREYAAFETPRIDLAYNCSLVTLRYWYHGYGSDLLSLTSKLVDAGGEHWIHFIKMLSYNEWFLVESSFKPFSKFKVRFTATRDDGWESDYAVDDISITQTDCNENALTQFSCTFEDGVCGFEQDWDDDTNFFLSTRQTLSSSTGPSGDFTDMSDTTGYFIYLEGTDPSPQPNGAIARVRTPWIDLSSTGACAAALNFWYHAFGAALGDLRVYYHLDDGSNDKLLWSQGGSSEDKWKSKLLLLPLKNTKFQIVFEAQRGNDHESDYAIDDVNILTQMNCENLAFGKEAYAGSTNAVSPYQALDGNQDPIYSHKSCWESNAMTDPWFVVDLQRYTFITTVTITGRGDCCNDRLHDFVISVSDEFDIDRGHNSSTWTWCSNFTGTWPGGGATDTFNCASPLAGRYVSIQIEGNNEIMNLCEIQVKGDDNSGLPYETSCDFENSTICNFNQLTSDQFDWTLKSGSTPTASTGPSADPITKEGIGHYLYIEVDGQSNGAIAALETPDLEVHQCGLVTLRFWAHIYGGDVNALTVILLEKESGQSTFNRNMKLFHLNEVRNAWKEHTWILQPSGITHFKIQFNGIAGSGTGGDIAIDGIRVIQVPGNCIEVVSTPASFQFDSDNCGFTQDKDEELEWTLYKREAPGRSSTGPQADRTGNDGFYYLLEPRYQTASSQAIARIRSPWINISQEHCQATVSFEYHAFGSHLVTFNVKYQINGSSQVYTAWSHDGSSQDQWRHVDVLLNTTERFQVIFEGIKASGATVDDSSIAIDDITITNAACGCTPPPNGTMASYSPVKTHYRNSEEVQYTCDAGYSQSAGNISFTCGVTGQWTGGAPLECDRCNDPGEGVNATKTVGGYQIGGDVTYGCFQGYDVVNGSLRLTCQANFTWDGYPPTCAYLADKTQCTSPWGYGYWGNCFIINSTEVSPSEARRKCLEVGGYIAVPTDTGIKSHLQNVLSTLPQYSSISKWLVGLHDPYSLNVYRSVDGSFVDVTGIMDSNEPSDVWSQFMVMSQGSGYLLQDFNDTASSFICQKNYGYLGCYQKPTTSKAEVTSDKHMSALQCIEYCRGLDYPIVAVSLTHCYCRTSYNDLAKADEMMCEQTCTGNSLENCGGANHALLFIGPMYHLRALTCESLKSQGVVLPGKYWIRPDGKEVSLRVECFMEPCSESLLSSSQVEVSSEAAAANFQKQNINLYDEGAWAPNTSDSAPWVKLTFNTRRIVTGIITQGGYTTQSTSTNWITRYRVSYNDEKGWHNYSSNGTLELSGNTDWNGLVTQYMQPPFIADAISIHLLAWNGRPELRLEVLGCSIQSLDDNDNYVGCYIESSGALSEMPVSAGTVTTADECINNCRNLDMIYAGISVGNCSCSNSLGRIGKLKKSSYCQQRCSGNTNQYCGDEGMLSVYRVWDSQCPPIPQVSHARSNSTSRTHGSVVGYQCDTGYMFPSDAENITAIQCAQAQWTQTPPDCQVVNCTTSPPSVANSTSVQGGIRYGSRDSQRNLYDEGAWAPNTSDSGPWVKLTFSTRRIVTGIVTQGGYTTQSTSTNWITQYRVSYNDEKGWHNYSSNGTLELSGNTDWNGLVTQYMQPPFIADAISIHLLAWNGRPELRLEVLGCSVQSLDDNDNYVGCYIESSGALSEMPVSAGTVTTADECINNCRNLDMIYAGISVGNCSCSNSLGRIGKLKKSSYCQQRCSGNTNQYCGDEGMLSVYRVWDSQCPPIPQVSHARSNSTSRTHGSVVGYQCDTGYTFPSDAENITAIQCAQAQWTQTPPDCQVVNCTTSPPSVANSTGVQGGIRYGNHVNYTCYNGYQLPNGAIFTQSTCQADGTWTNILVHCEHSQCPPIPQVSHARSNSTSRTHGSVVGYQCDTGYMFPSDAENITAIQCAQAQWTQTPPDCQVVNCTTSPPSVANSTSVQGGIRYGSRVNYTCYNGYQLPNGAIFTQSTCQADGTWTNILVHCEPKHCGSRPSVTNALVVLDEGTVVTSRISYHCNPGYQIEGSDGLVQEVTCSLEAQWNTTALENCTGFLKTLLS